MRVVDGEYCVDLTFVALITTLLVKLMFELTCRSYAEAPFTGVQANTTSSIEGLLVSGG